MTKMCLKKLKNFTTVQENNKKIKSFPILKKGEIYNVYKIVYSNNKRCKVKVNDWIKLKYLYMTEYNIFFKDKIGLVTSVPRHNNLIYIEKYTGGDV